MSTEPTVDETHTDAPVPPVAPPVQWTDPDAPAPPPAGWTPFEGHDDEPSPRAARRWPFVPRSLTSRLVVGVTGLVVVLVMVTSACTYVALRSFLYNRLDQQLQTAATPSAVTRLLANRQLPGFDVVPQKVWVAVVDSATGDPATEQPAGPDLAAMTLSSAARSRLKPGTDKPVSQTTTSGEHVRVVGLTGFSLASNGEPVTILVGLSLSEVDRTLHRLVLLEWIIGAAAILLAFGATSWGVQFSLRRLRRVTATAHEVAAELSPEGRGLDRRVPQHEADEGTEVGQLASSMNTLLEAVQTQFAARLASEHRMRQFLADASHELRTPLTSIRGYAELARMQRQHGTPTEDNLARIESEGTRMSRLVDDLLTLARSDQGTEPARELVDVGQVVDEAVSGARAAFPQRRIELDAPIGLHVIGDRDQLLRVVRNLVTNAAVHTRADGPIRVSAVAEGPFAVLRVIDSGPGLPPEEAAHVFERFWRADKARTRASGGSGLGLAIVASLVAAHGGTVQFDSDVATGSTITVRLPRGETL